MDKKLKRKWVAALESGKYKQGQSYLKCQNDDDFKYCCLGVLCEVAGVKQGIQQGNVVPFGGSFYKLTPTLLKKFKIDGEDQSKLIDMNDGSECEVNPRGRKMKFTTIAKWIAKNL